MGNELIDPHPDPFFVERQEFEDDEARHEIRNTGCPQPPRGDLCLGYLPDEEDTCPACGEVRVGWICQSRQCVLEQYRTEGE